MSKANFLSPLSQFYWYVFILKILLPDVQISYLYCLDVYVEYCYVLSFLLNFMVSVYFSKKIFMNLQCIILHR